MVDAKLGKVMRYNTREHMNIPVMMSFSSLVFSDLSATYPPYSAMLMAGIASESPIIPSESGSFVR